MRSLLFVLISFLIPFMGCNASEPAEVSSRITDVTVFLRGAQVTRQAKISLINGVNTLAFRDLPLNIDPQSIQAKGSGNFVILSLSHQVNYLAGQRKSLQVKQLQDSLRLSEEQLALVNGMQAVMKSEEEMLIANRAIGS